VSAPARKNARILIADDHPIVRKGLRHIVEGDPGLQVVAETATADETLTAAARTPCDVIVLDLGLPGAVGLSVLKGLRSAVPHVPVLILSTAPEDHFGTRAIRAGAAGYVAKRSAPDQLVGAIRTVAAGGLYISPVIGLKLAQDLLRPPPRVGRDAFRLSDREIEVLRLLGAGVSGEDIAARLSISAKTVSTYRRRLLTKLGLDSTAALIRYAIEQRILDA
jgi:two-component system invasion response regulator UvrY